MHALRAVAAVALGLSLAHAQQCEDLTDPLRILLLNVKTPPQVNDDYAGKSCTDLKMMFPGMCVDGDMCTKSSNETLDQQALKHQICESGTGYLKRRCAKACGLCSKGGNYTTHWTPFVFAKRFASPGCQGKELGAPVVRYICGENGALPMAGSSDGRFKLKEAEQECAAHCATALNTTCEPLNGRFPRGDPEVARGSSIEVTCGFIEIEADNGAWLWIVVCVWFVCSCCCLTGSVVAAFIAKRQGFSSPLFGCFSDLNSCIVTTICPCYAFGVVAAAQDHGQSMGGLWGSCLLFACCNKFALCLGVWNRHQFRKARNIRGEVCEDICIHAFAQPCALCQEWREVKSGSPIAVVGDGRPIIQAMEAVGGVMIEAMCPKSAGPGSRILVLAPGIGECEVVVPLGVCAGQSFKARATPRAVMATVVSVQGSSVHRGNDSIHTPLVAVA